MKNLEILWFSPGQYVDVWMFRFTLPSFRTDTGKALIVF